MKVFPTEIPDVLIIEPQVFRDDRGFFFETFQAPRYTQVGLPATMVQDNHSGSKAGVLRGLHYQIQHAQGKLVSVTVGEIFDVAVDLRRHSPTFCHWVGVHLKAEERKQLWVPPGFAHGYLVLTPWAELNYKCTDIYYPEWERTLIWDDPTVAICWPLAGHQRPILSAKDDRGIRLEDAPVFEN
jgi:dTDP-4-dehydrorhamnose 3,5-epimerase